jgi:hypothetical protein
LNAAGRLFPSRRQFAGPVAIRLLIEGRELLELHSHHLDAQAHNRPGLQELPTRNPPLLFGRRGRVVNDACRFPGSLWLGCWFYLCLLLYDAQRTVAALREAPLSSIVVKGLAEVLAAY